MIENSKPNSKLATIAAEYHWIRKDVRDSLDFGVLAEVKCLN